MFAPLSVLHVALGVAMMVVARNARKKAFCNGQCMTTYADVLQR